MSECPCKDWKDGMKQINGFIVFGFTHGQHYTAKPFKHCPWCGAMLPEEKKKVNKNKDKK